VFFDVGGTLVPEPPRTSHVESLESESERVSESSSKVGRKVASRVHNLCMHPPITTFSKARNVQNPRHIQVQNQEPSH
jgi:hypothetical protein